MENGWLLATYPAGDGKVRGVNANGYKGWFNVFWVIKPEFTDVQGHWAEQVTNRMNGLAIIEGYPDPDGGLKRPAKLEQSTTRAEFVSLLHRLLNIDVDKPKLSLLSKEETQEVLKSKFTDTDDIPLWAAEAVAATAKAGLVEGRNGKFMADTPITRIEAAVMVSKAYKTVPGYKTMDLSKFKDAEDIPDWAKVGLADDVMQGYSDGTLRPNEEINRAEALTVLHMLFVNFIGL